MRPLYFIRILIPCLIFSVSSCQKKVDVPATQQDSVSSVLPKQIIVTLNDNTPPTTDVYSIKYDTANFKIELYQDDTTNTNPYDVLFATYKYNNSGYLTGITSTDENRYSSTYINRAPNNSLIWITTYDPNNDETDSTFFQYQAVNGNTLITTIAKQYYAGLTPDLVIDTIVYTYDNNYKLLQMISNSGYGSSTDTYTYNSNNSIDKIVSQYYYGTNTQTNFFYTSGIPDGTRDIPLETFAGKDFYLENIKELSPFVLLYAFPFPSATDPYHFTRIQDIVNGSAGEDRTYTYELNANKLVSKVNSTTTGNSTPPNTFEFRY